MDSIFSGIFLLGAIGFVWNPLPSLVELTMVWLWPVLPSLVNKALAGVVLSSLATAGQVTVLFRVYRKKGSDWKHALPLVLLFAVNPFLLLYGANGMSEMVFSFFLVGTTLAYVEWRNTRSGEWLAVAGLSLALGFLTRYEAVAFGVALAIAVGIDCLYPSGRGPLPRIRPTLQREQKNSNSPRKERIHYLIGSWTVLLTPSIYAGLIWIALNGIIMGNPLYFFHSNYSNLAQSSVLKGTAMFAHMAHHFWPVIEFVWQRAWLFSLPLFAILLSNLAVGQLFSLDSFILVLLSSSIPFLQVILLFQGASYGWLRFFFYPLPIAFAWYANTPSHRNKRHRLTPSSRHHPWVMGLSLLVCACAVGLTMDNNPVLAPQEYTMIHTGGSVYQQMETTRKIAAYINQYLPGKTILMDSFTAYNVIINSKDPQSLMITSDFLFKQALMQPNLYHVQYILVPSPQGTSKFDAVNLQYPTLYNKGASFVRLQAQFSDWKLYRVLPPVPIQSGSPFWPTLPRVIPS